MLTANECEPAVFFFRPAGAGRSPRRRRLSGRLALAAAALILLASPVPALASHGTMQGPPPAASAGFDPCPHAEIMRAYLHFRIFACNDGPSALVDIKTARAYLHSLWGPETELMGDPVPDHAEPKENGRIDFYLVTAGQTLSRGAYTGDQAIDLSKHHDLGQAPWEEIKGTVSSGFAVVLRPESLPKGDSFKSVLAHELFHILQFAHNTTLSCDKFWFLEASAKWAEWYFVPQAAGHMVYPWFRDFQDKPQVSLTDSKNKAPYSDWAWPLFMQQQEGPGSIAAAWTAMQDKTGCDDLNTAVNSVLPFNSSFGDFAAENFDYRLPNLITGKKAWPVNFKANYPRFRRIANPKAPAFPQEPPRYESVALHQNHYPYTATVHVDLPPLSAQYRQIPLIQLYPYLGGGGSVEFDFSGLSPAGNADVTLLAADGQRSGYAVNNGTWERIDLGGGDTHAKVCLSADGTKRDHPLKGAIYVIVGNHSSGPLAAPVTGSYTVSQRTACATALSGALAISQTFNEAGGEIIIQQNANITIHMANSPFENLGNGFGAWQVAPGGSWSEQWKQTTICSDGPSEVTTAGGSGPFITSDINAGFVTTYLEPYQFRPTFGAYFLSEEEPTTQSGGCPSGAGNVPMTIGQGCPVSSVFFNGIYTAEKAGVNLKCSGTSNSDFYTIKISGILTATDPIQCGLWTKSCPIGSSTITRAAQSSGWPS
jgi:hypothetical protein